MEYINFNNDKYAYHRSLENVLDYCKKSGREDTVDEEEVIRRMLKAPEYRFTPDFFKINNLPEVSSLTRAMFEIVER